MTEDRPNRSPDIPRAAQALAHLTQAAGVRRGAGELERRLQQCWPAPGEDARAPLDWLALAADDHGLRAQRFEGTVQEAVRRLDLGRPLLGMVPRDGALRWIVLLGRKGRKVRLACYGDGETGERTVRLGDLEQELGLAADARAAWMFADPAAPLAEAESRQAPLPPLPRLMRLVRPDRADILAVVLFSIAMGVLLLATPIAVQALVNFVAFGGAIPPLIVVALLLFLGLAFAGLLNALESWVVEILQRRVFVRTLADLSARLPRITSATHDHYYAPELVNRFFDVMTIQKAGSFLLLDGIGLALSVLVGLVVLAFYHPLLLAFDIVMLVVIALLVLAPARRGVRTAIVESNAKYAVASWLEELARSPLAFKTAGAQQWIFEHSDRLASTWIQSRATHFRVVFGQIIGALGLQAVASTVLLALGGLLVINGDLSLGQLVAAELIVNAVVASFAKTGKHLESFYDLMAATQKVGKLLDLPLEPRGGEHHTPPREAAGSALRLDALTWERPDGHTLFEDLSLELPAGGSLCVRGHSGSGKSALVQLLWGLREPARGRIVLDGVDLRELSLESLRRTVAVVSGLEVVEATVRENVRLGRPWVSDEDVRAALRAVRLTERLSGLPDGVDTELRAHGHPLSDGELRRMVLARAIVGGPRVLIVDELLDGLSIESRAEVLDALFDADARWTLVVVSNAPEVAARCDQVLTMPSGELVPGAAEASTPTA